MIAIFWKDLRENLKWGLLALLGVGGAVAYLAIFARQREVPIELLLQIAWAVAILGAAGAGLILGLLPMLTDNFRHRWAFLTHRPVSRSAIFAGKVAAGLVLYSMAAALPMALGIAWFSRPGHVLGPVYVEMAAPVMVDLLMGVAYYCAAALIVMRDARWYASRIMPLGLPIIGTLATLIVPSVGAAFGIGIALTTILGLGAWGAFLVRGDQRIMPAWGKAPAGVAVLAGIVLAGGIGLAVVSETIASLNRPFGRTETFSTYLFLPDGQVVLARYENNVCVSITGPRGEALPEETKDLARLAQTRRVPETLSASIALPGKIEFLSSYRWQAGWYRYGYELLNPVNWSTGPGSVDVCYYLPRERRIAVYSRETSLRTGSIGPDGFVPEPGQARPFSSPPIGVYYLPSLFATANAVYELTPSVGIREIYRAPAGVKLFGVGLMTDQNRLQPPLYCIASDQGILITDASAKQVARIPYLGDIRNYWDVSVVRTTSPDLYSVSYSPAPAYWQQRLSAATPPSTIYELHNVATGKTQTFDLPDISTTPDEPPMIEALPKMFAPPVVIPFILLADPNERLAGFTWPPQRTFDKVVVFGMVGLCILSALANWFIAQRYAMSIMRRIVWAAVGLVANAGGALLMLSMEVWPARLTCPACGRRRIVTRDQCEHCGALWTPPALEGTEIIDEPVAVAV